MRLSAAGQYRVVLLSNDGYNVLAEQTIVVSNWTSDCTGGCKCPSWLKWTLGLITSSVDCRVSGCQSGTCDTTSGQCQCDAGHFWYDCSLGCSGIQILSANSSLITDGGDNRPSSGFNVSCGWLITPPEPFDNITVVFDTFEVSENTPLSTSLFPLLRCKYSWLKQRSIKAIPANSCWLWVVKTCPSHSSRVREVSFCKSVGAILGTVAFHWTTSRSTRRLVCIISETSESGTNRMAALRTKISVDWDSAAGLAMTILTGVMVLVVTASFITIFVKREHFVVKASSFVFTGTSIVVDSVGANSIQAWSWAV